MRWILALMINASKVCGVSDQIKGGVNEFKALHQKVDVAVFDFIRGAKSI